MDIEFLDWYSYMDDCYCNFIESFSEMVDRNTKEYKDHVENGYSPVYSDLYSSMVSDFSELFDFILKFIPPYKFQELVDDIYKSGVAWEHIYIEKVVTHATDNRYPVPHIPDGLQRRVKRRNRMLKKLM